MATQDTKKNATVGVASALMVLCCVAGPAVVGAVGGAATGSVVIGAVVAACLARVVYVGLRLVKSRSQEC